jgi:hypothetical protein
MSLRKVMVKAFRKSRDKYAVKVSKDGTPVVAAAAAKTPKKWKLPE